MREEEKFDIIYEKLYNKYFNKYEKLRKSEKRNYVIAIIGFALILLSFAFEEDETQISTNISAFLGITGIILVLIKVFLYKKTNYEDLYKKEVITEFVHEILPNFKYKPHLSAEYSSAIIKNYKTAKFDNKITNIEIVDDYMCGMIDLIKIYLCDMSMSYTYIDENKERRVENTFSGLFANIKLEVNKEVYIKILNRSTYQGDNSNVVKLDNDDFNKNFVVVSTSAINAYEILTSDVIEFLNNYLKDYIEKEDTRFDISILDNNIYFRFHTAPIFEASFNECIMKKENFYRYYTLLNFILKFSRDINEIYKNLNV